MKENRFVTWICKHHVCSIVIVLLFFIVGIPVLINLCYSCDYVFYVTHWEAADVLAYYGTVLGAAIAVATVAITISFNRKQIQRETYLSRENEKWKNIELCLSNILRDINPVNVLSISPSLDMQNPHESIIQLQSYQMTCRTATSRLTSHISTLDFPKVELLVGKITEASEKLFQIADNEVAELSKCYTIQIGRNSEIILSNLLQHPEYATPDEVEKNAKAVDDAKEWNIDQVRASIGSVNQELVTMWNTEYQELLQLKGQTFEKIYAQIGKDADAILRFGRKKNANPQMDRKR